MPQLSSHRAFKGKSDPRRKVGSMISSTASAINAAPTGVER